MKNLLILVILAIILVGGFIWFIMTQKPSEEGLVYTEIITFDKDTTIDGDHIVGQQQKTTLKNGSTLTINGNLKVQGALECENGPLSVIVKGDLRVEGLLMCNRSEDISDSDIGSGLSLVVEGSITFSDEAIVVSNGHVQVVDDKEKLAKTQEKIDSIYDEVTEDTGDIPRIGPFVGEEEGVSINLPSGNLLWPQRSDGKKGDLSVPQFLVSQALARDVPTERRNGEIKPAKTVRIGGRWFVGDPGKDPPDGLDIPTPPKKVKKIIVLYNFGPGRDVNLVNFTLSGPDGREGEDDVDRSCTARGKDGGDAMRFRVIASNIKVNNFFLFPGDGGDGGQAVTKKKCKHGKATGGKGGNAGNVKMEASGSFIVEGTFQLWPGWGGFGGRALAYGEDGEDGCPGKDGGDTTATGGKGGDNKKKLRIQNVEGVSNIQIGIMFAGPGGNAKARPGKGGNGTGCKCDGGKGGTGVAIGGKGGDAKLDLAAGVGRTPGADEDGGSGGDADARGGKGGKGGMCDALDAGGSGGDGGDATPTGGEGGSGTNPGNSGNENEQAGDGGDGGDGCPEGKGGAGGTGNTLGNNGVDGKDGKNLCVVLEEETGVQPPPETPGAGELVVNPAGVRKQHVIGESSCPDPLGGVSITGPEGGFWQVDPETVPRWLDIPETGMIETEIVQMELSFNCNITDFSTHQESARVRIQGFDANEQPIGDSFFDVFIDVVAQ